MSMSMNHWEAAEKLDLMQLKWQIDTLKMRLESGFRDLQAQLSADLAAIEAEVRRLEARATLVELDPTVSKIQAQIDWLRTKGDEAYERLQADLQPRVESVDADIRRLEAIAAEASDEAKLRIMARIEELRVEQGNDLSPVPPEGQDPHARDWPNG